MMDAFSSQIRATLLWAAFAGAALAQLPPGVTRERVFPTGRLPLDTVATVNGEKVSQAKFHQGLIDEAGQKVIRLLIKEAVIRQAATAAGVFFTADELEKDFQAQLLRARAALRERTGSDKPSLEEVLGVTGQTFEHFQATLRLQTELARMADALVLMKRLQMERVQVRMIHVKQEQEAVDILALLAQGAEFGNLARQRSVDPSSKEKGLLPPFGQGGGVIHPDYQKVEEAAFALQHPGEISPLVPVLNAGNRKDYFILQLVSRIPASPGGFMELKDKIADLRGGSEKPTTEELDALVGLLMDQAEVVIDLK